MKMRSYGGNYIDPSVNDLAHGSAGHKKQGHTRAELSYPTYPDSVDGYVKETNEAINSVRPRQNKRSNRFS